MRLLLDAHVSARGVGRPLERKGHDVIALAEDSVREALGGDEEVLALAREESRILVTHDVADFPPILREWAADGRRHAGVILVHGVDHSEFRLVIEGIGRLLTTRPKQEAWADVCEVLSRSRAA